MDKTELLKSVEAPANSNIPQLSPGDAVSVYLKIKEGERERIQVFKGTVLFVRGRGNDATFTVRRIASNGIGVERTFLMRSPRIEKVEVERHSKVRRARLYFLRDRTGKAARLKQRFNGSSARFFPGKDSQEMTRLIGKQRELLLDGVFLFRRKSWLFCDNL